MIYETKGLTLEQVDELYSEVSSARNSVGWKPTVTFMEIVEQKGSESHHHDERKEETS